MKYFNNNDKSIKKDRIWVHNALTLCKSYKILYIINNIDTLFMYL